MNELQQEEITYFQAKGKELLQERGMSSSEFAEQMGIARQNVNKVFSTKNILTLRQVSKVLNIPLSTLIASPEEINRININGFIQVNQHIIKIQNKSDILSVIAEIEALENELTND